jgi:hypothetical protein
MDLLFYPYFTFILLIEKQQTEDLQWLNMRGTEILTRRRETSVTGRVGPSGGGGTRPRGLGF